MTEKGVKASELADSSGVSRQLISEYSSGKKVAGADNLFSLADSLGVQARWLLRGQGDRYRASTSEAVEQTFPKLDLFAFGEHGKPEPVELVAIPPIILQSMKVRSDIWLAEMPSDAMPSLAAEGEILICRDPEPALQDRRIYVFLIDGRPIVRRVFVRPDGLQLRSEVDGETILITPHDLESVTPIARVVSAISVHSV